MPRYTRVIRRKEGRGAGFRHHFAARSVPHWADMSARRSNSGSLRLNWLVYRNGCELLDTQDSLAHGHANGECATRIWCGIACNRRLNIRITQFTDKREEAMKFSTIAVMFLTPALSSTAYTAKIVVIEDGQPSRDIQVHPPSL